MNRENIAKLAMREKQKIADAEEDKRLMKEYRERLDRYFTPKGKGLDGLAVGDLQGCLCG